MIATDMASKFIKPDPKKQLSARVRGSSLLKAAAVVDAWRLRAELEGDKDAAEQVDVTYVVDILLADALDAELAQWGGFPDSPEAKAAFLKAVKQTAKQ